MEEENVDPAETASEAEQPEAAPLDPDPKTKHTPQAEIAIGPGWFNRHPPNRKG